MSSDSQDKGNRETKKRKDNEARNFDKEVQTTNNSNSKNISVDEESFAELAIRFLEKQKIVVFPSDTGGKATTFYCTKDNIWKPIGKDDLKLFAIKIHKEDTKKNREEIIDYARSIMLEKINKQGFKIPEWDKLLPYEIPFASGIVNIQTNTIRPITPEDYLTVIIPHKYNPDSTCPVWLNALEDWGLDEKQKLALQEFFGYILSNSTGFKKALLLVGETDTGKSRPVYIAEYMVGISNFCKIDPSRMGDPSTMAQIYGKKLNGLHELGEDSKLGKYFREVIDNNPVSINEKFIPRFSYKPCCKHIFATNEHIGLGLNKAGNDASIRRLIVINFNKKIQKQDPLFNEKIFNEIDGVINWAIEGLKRLLEKGDFTDCSNEAAKIIIDKSKENNSDELSLFTKTYEGFEFNESFEIKKEDFFKIFMTQMGFDPDKPPEKWNKIKIGKLMAANGFSSYYRGGKIPMYKGLRLKSEFQILKTSKEASTELIKNELKLN